MNLKKEEDCFESQGLIEVIYISVNLSKHVSLYNSSFRSGFWLT